MSQNDWEILRQLTVTMEANRDVMGEMLRQGARSQELLEENKRTLEEQGRSLNTLTEQQKTHSEKISRLERTMEGSNSGQGMQADLLRCQGDIKSLADWRDDLKLTIRNLSMLVISAVVMGIAQLFMQFITSMRK